MHMNSPFYYEIRYPENMNPNKKYPVIFAMHGIGSHEKNILEMLDAVKDEFILIGMRGSILFIMGILFLILSKLAFLFGSNSINVCRI